MTDLSYISPGQLEQLNDSAARYTHFSTFADLVNVENNYRPTLYYDQSISNIAWREITALASAYDNHMVRTNDARRIYRA